MTLPLPSDRRPQHTNPPPPSPPPRGGASTTRPPLHKTPRPPPRPTRRPHPLSTMAREVPLGRVLRHDNTPTWHRPRRPPRNPFHDPGRRHPRRRQHSMRRYLPGTIIPQSTDHHGRLRYHRLFQPRQRRRATLIPKSAFKVVQVVTPLSSG